MRKFKGIASLVWDFDLESEASQQQAQKEATIAARDWFEQVVLPLLPAEVAARFKITTKAQIVKAKTPKKVRHGEFSIEQVLPFTVADESAEGAVKEYTDGKGQVHKVKMSSLRYQVFVRDNCTCVCCGLVGTKLFLESTGHAHGHFNLYGIENDKEILFTKDHIIPVSHGGGESLANLQTMCYICNLLKANSKTITMEQLRALRLIYNEHPVRGKEITALRLGLAEKGNFGLAVDKKRRKKEGKKEGKTKAKCPQLLVKEDLCIWEIPCQGYVALSAGSKPPKGAISMHETIKANTLIVPRKANDNGYIYVDFGEEGRRCRIVHTLLDVPAAPPVAS
jgi:5-methylcytosine-specific restriction endonuclease McrA